jgi:hypothetical protein
MMIKQLNKKSNKGERKDRDKYTMEERNTSFITRTISKRHYEKCRNHGNLVPEICTDLIINNGYLPMLGLTR